MKTAAPKKHKPTWGELDPTTNTRSYPLHRFQSEVLSSTARITAAMAGTGGGKSCICPLWLIGQIQKNNGKGRYLVVSPTYKIFKQSRLLDAWAEAVEGTQLQGSHHKTDNIYKCGTGAEVFFRSAENPNSLEGGQYDALVIDEAAKISHDAWIKGSARVGQKQGPILLVSTPDSNNWIHSEIFKLCDAPPNLDIDGGAIRTSLDGKTKVVQWASTINPSYSKEELERQRRILPDAIFRRRYLGEFAKLEGLVYPEFTDTIIEEHVPAILNPPAVMSAGGIDWGYNDPTAILVGIEAQDGRVYLVEEVYERQLPIHELTEKLKALQKKWNISVFFCDHSRPEIRDLLRRAGLPVKMKNVHAIETGIAMVSARVRTGYLKTYLDCKALIDEATKYQRKATDHEGTYSEKAVDRDNHSCDALRYLITGLDFGRTLSFDFTPDDPEETELSAQIRLGQISDDPIVRQEQELKAQQQAYIDWHIKWVNAEVDDQGGW